MGRSFIKKFFKHKTLGQSTAEYLIILILVSISSIGVMSLFGKSVRLQVGKVIAAFTGESEELKDIKTQATVHEAVDRAKKGVTMKGISSEEIEEYNN